MVTALRNSSWGAARALFGFTLIAGLALTPILTSANGWRTAVNVALAGADHVVIFFALATVATVTTKDFGFMGKFLFVGMIVLV